MKLFPAFALIAAKAVFAVPAAMQQVDDPNVPKIDDPNFIGRIMDAHWYWRRIHCAQDLKWDPELAKQALESVSACTNMPQHVSTPHAVSHLRRSQADIHRTAVAAISHPSAPPQAVTKTGSSLRAPLCTAGMKRSSSIPTTIRTTMMPGVTSRRWSGARALVSDAHLATAPTMRLGPVVSTAVRNFTIWGKLFGC